VTVGTVNVPPVADASASQTNAISGNNSNAVVHLDGTRSSDADGDPLTYVWFVDGGVVPVASGATADVTLDVGDHTVTLVVDDGLAHSSATIHVSVLTAGEAVDNLIDLVNDASMERKNKRPFIASLKAASASLERGNFQSGANQLHAFQNKIRAQVGKTDPIALHRLSSGVQRAGTIHGCPLSLRGEGICFSYSAGTLHPSEALPPVTWISQCKRHTAVAYPEHLVLNLFHGVEVYPG
jgi:hypothetical protein